MLALPTVKGCIFCKHWYLKGNQFQRLQESCPKQEPIDKCSRPGDGCHKKGTSGISTRNHLAKIFDNLDNYGSATVESSFTAIFRHVGGSDAS